MVGISLLNSLICLKFNLIDCFHAHVHHHSVAIAIQQRIQCVFVERHFRCHILSIGLVHIFAGIFNLIHILKPVHIHCEACIRGVQQPFAFLADENLLAVRILHTLFMSGPALFDVLPAAGIMRWVQANVEWRNRLPILRHPHVRGRPHSPMKKMVVIAAAKQITQNSAICQRNREQQNLNDDDDAPHQFFFVPVTCC